MIEKLTSKMEPNRTLRLAEIFVFCGLLISSLVCYIMGFSKVHADPGKLEYLGTVELERQFDEEDYDEDRKEAGGCALSSCDDFNVFSVIGYADGICG